MKRKKKLLCLSLLLACLLLCGSGCKARKAKKQATNVTTEATTEDKTGFVPDEEEDGPVDNEMRDDDGNVYETDPQK